MSAFKDNGHSKEPTLADLGAERVERACTECVRSKAKCSPSSSVDNICERCLRMSKPCIPSPPRRRRVGGHTSRSTAAKKMKNLQVELSELVQALKSASQDLSGPQGVDLDSRDNHPGQGGTDSSDQHVSPVDLNSTASSTLHPVLGSQDIPSRSNYNLGDQQPEHLFAGLVASPWTQQGTFENTPIESNNSESHKTTSDDSELSLHSASITLAEAEACLSIFTKHFLIQVPFFVLPERLTAKKLREDLPNLWLAIMNVTTNKITRQAALSKMMRESIMREVFLGGARNMDTLLAIITYAFWHRHKQPVEPSSTTLLTQLAIGIIYDLGLDKGASHDTSVNFIYDFKGLPKPARLGREATLEERRALLGCYLLSTTRSYMRIGQSLDWTEYCEECLNTLDRNPEVPSDLLLAQLVKIRLFSERTFALSAPHDAANRSSRMVIPYSSYLKTQLEQFRILKSQIHPTVANNKFLLSELHTAEYIIYEFSLSQNYADLFILQPGERLQALSSCLQAVKAWINIYLTIPFYDYVGFPSCMFVKMARSFINISRLAFHDYPGWDSTVVPKCIDMASILLQVETNYSKLISAENGRSSGDDPPRGANVTLSKLRFMRETWDTIVAPTTITEPAGHTTQQLDDWFDLPLGFMGPYMFWNNGLQ